MRPVILSKDKRAAILAAMRRGELTPDEIAPYFNISRATAYRMAKAAGINLKAARCEYVARRVYTLTVGRFEARAIKRDKAAEAFDDLQAIDPDKIKRIPMGKRGRNKGQVD